MINIGKESSGVMNRGDHNTIGQAIGDGIIIVGGHNVHLSNGRIIDKDLKITPKHQNKVISNEQAFERIGAAVRSNLKQLEQNIEQARKESSQMFKLTLIFASVGFVVIFVGIVLLYLEQTTAGIVSTVSSIIPEVTALLFFSKDKELRDTITAYHNHMLKSQKLLTMIDVAETITNSAERDKIKQEIISKVLEID